MITINGKKSKNPKIVLKLIRENGFNKQVCVIINGKIIPKKEWDKFKIKDGDVVEVVGFVGGG